MLAMTLLEAIVVLKFGFAQGGHYAGRIVPPHILYAWCVK
jgi:hypothetical protein